MIASDSATKREAAKEAERKRKGKHKSLDLRNPETYLDKIGKNTRSVTRRSSVGSVRNLNLGVGRGLGSGFFGVNTTSSCSQSKEFIPSKSVYKRRESEEARSIERLNSRARERENKDKAERRERAQRERDSEIERVNCMMMTVETEIDSCSSRSTTGIRRSIGSSGRRATGGGYGVIDLDSSYSGLTSVKKGPVAVVEGGHFKRSPMLFKPGGGHQNQASL